MKTKAKTPKLNLRLVGLDGNAFALLAAFRRQAQKQQWDKEELIRVLDEAKSGDYEHLLATLAAHCRGFGL